ncbi:phage regulatory CII family protein [Brevundimonas sp.]|uniref:phage regulatory CII family protein n=1 Tax=Brevundimonas sp. TaxID=1871086 RepID=UPI0022CC8C56|nr:phage regulatory CII family protein [Brevundimonas sp.]MCZ8195253.1 hypothetical protein [Brevundimonas sp.]
MKDQRTVEGKRRAACGFARIAYQIVVVEKAARTRELAAALGLSSAALYGRLRGRSGFRPEEARALIRLVPDPRLIRYFADDSRHIVARRPVGQAGARSIEAATAETLREAIDILEVVTSALRDGGPLTHRHRALILSEVRQAETATANLRAAVEALSTSVATPRP